MLSVIEEKEKQNQSCHLEDDFCFRRFTVEVEFVKYIELSN